MDKANLSGRKHAPGPIEMHGAFLDDFEVLNSLQPHEVPGAIEGDRPFFVARSGFYRKLLPLRIEESGAIFSGGRYLFRTYSEAAAFGRWLDEDFRVDGRLFVERPWVRDLTAAPFHVVGAHDFSDVHDSQFVVRVERWTLTGERGSTLDSAWPAIRDRAASAGLASVWLIFSDERREAALVTVGGRVGAHVPSALDAASLAALAAKPSPAEEVAAQSWARKTFDRTSWILTIWFAPDHRPLQLWPNSPPLPGLRGAAGEAAAGASAR